MASQHINIHNSGVMSGNVTTAGDVNVMPGGTLRVAKTTIGGNLENGGTVQMNSEGGKPGNVLTVNGNYTGNNGLMTFNATLGGDNSPTDKMNVKGDTQGNTRVRVDNIGGVGAQTVNGIELNDWCIPKGITPTTHIIKLPIGEIRQPNATLDLSQSVDNEYYCLLLAKELGLNVPDAEIIKAGNVRALAVERFDRRWNAERTVLLRLPQEDMCQTFGLPSSVKYESDGGPGIARIMAFLMGSSEALKDRYDFMKFQVFQWLIGATDGHAKNFSVFIQAGGSYRLTPFYDIISAFPVLGGTGIHISDLKLAMGLNASKGKKTAIDKIYPRHFLATAKVLRFPEVQMHEILSDFARMIPAALDNVKTSLPTDFPENVVTAVETNVLRLHGRLSREYGSK
ncbi:HipA domain-containing protein [Escherichia coli]|nr:HipA domain-containing protein [Escherichia coli]